MHVKVSGRQKLENDAHFAHVHTYGWWMAADRLARPLHTRHNAVDVYDTWELVGDGRMSAQGVPTSWVI